MNEIVPIQDRLKEAEVLIKSGFLPYSIKTPEQVVVITMKGKELGLPPLEALNSINVIQGKPTVSPQCLLALARRSKELKDISIDYEDDHVSVTIERKGQKAHTETFGVKEAKAMGLISKDNWKRQPQVMMRWRALSACLRIVFSDVCSGLYIHEELAPDKSYDDDGVPEDKIKTIEVQEGKEVAEMAEKGQLKLEKQRVAIELDPTNIMQVTDDVLYKAKEKRKLITDALLVITNDDLARAKELLKSASSFVSKDGDVNEGVESTAKLTGKWLNMTWHNVKALAAQHQAEKKTVSEFKEVMDEHYPGHSGLKKGDSGMIDFANDKLGALWEKTSSKGTPMLTGKIGEQAVVAFKNKKREGKKDPDWAVYKSEPYEPKPKTDEMPF